MDRLNIVFPSFDLFGNEDDNADDFGDDFCHGLASFGQKDTRNGVNRTGFISLIPK